MQAPYKRVTAATAVAALLCGFILVLDWKFGRPDYTDDGSELVIRSAKEVPRLLASRASRDQSLANAEAVKVKKLEAKLKALESAGKEKVQTLAVASNASGSSDADGEKDAFGNPKQPGVLPGNTGEGYWDKEHKDDSWVPVGVMEQAVDERWSDNEAIVEQRKSGAYEWNVVGDKFEDAQADRDAVGKVENEVVQMNEQESEFANDDSFVAPPEELTPTHRLPLESFLPWQVEISTWMHSWMG